MKYSPSAIQSADLSIARKHSVGGEKLLYISPSPMILIGEVTFYGDGSGVYTPDAITGVGLPAGGYDLALKVREQILPVNVNQPVIFTVTGKDQGDVALTGTADFTPPGWVGNKGFDYSEGAALDVTVAATKKFKDVSNITAPNAARWSKALLVALPDTWIPIGMVDTVSPRIGINPPHPIAEGLKGAKEVVVGRSQPGSVEVKTKYRSVVDGLARYGGRPCCLRLDLQKQGKILTERHIFGNCIMDVNPDFPDGDEEVTLAASGMMEEYFGFFAK